MHQIGIEIPDPVRALSLFSGRMLGREYVCP